MKSVGLRQVPLRITPTGSRLVVASVGGVPFDSLNIDHVRAYKCALSMIGVLDRCNVCGVADIQVARAFEGSTTCRVSVSPSSTVVSASGQIPVRFNVTGVSYALTGEVTRSGELLAGDDLASVKVDRAGCVEGRVRSPLELRPQALVDAVANSVSPVVWKMAVARTPFSRVRLLCADWGGSLEPPDVMSATMYDPDGLVTLHVYHPDTGTVCIVGARDGSTCEWWAAEHPSTGTASRGLEDIGDVPGLFDRVCWAMWPRAWAISGALDEDASA